MQTEIRPSTDQILTITYTNSKPRDLILRWNKLTGGRVGRFRRYGRSGDALTKPRVLNQSVITESGKINEVTLRVSESFLTKQSFLQTVQKAKSAFTNKVNRRASDSGMLLCLFVCRLYVSVKLAPIKSDSCH